MTYIIVKNRKVEMMAYSMSCVALNVGTICTYRQCNTHP